MYNERALALVTVFGATSSLSTVAEYRRFLQEAETSAANLPVQTR